MRSGSSFLKQIRSRFTIQPQSIRAFNGYKTISCFDNNTSHNFGHNSLQQVHHRWYSKPTIQTQEFPPKSTHCDSTQSKPVPNEDKSEQDSKHSNDSSQDPKSDKERATKVRLFMVKFSMMEIVILGGLIYYLYFVRPRRLEGKNANSPQKLEEHEYGNEDGDNKSIDVHSFFDLDHPNGKVNAVIIACITLWIHLQVLLKLI